MIVIVLGYPNAFIAKSMSGDFFKCVAVVIPAKMSLAFPSFAAAVGDTSTFLYDANSSMAFAFRLNVCTAFSALPSRSLFYPYHPQARDWYYKKHETLHNEQG